MMNISILLKEVWHLFIQQHLCSKIISPVSQCHICQDICPQHSLQLVEDKWQINDCTKCGLCVAHCPQQVFQLDYPTLLQQADNEKILSLACLNYPNAPADCLKVQCLQQFSPLHLLTLSQKYKKVVVYLAQTTCDQCQHHWYCSLLTLQLEQYHLQQEKIEIINLQPAAKNEEQNKRRSFFQEVFRDSKSASSNFLSEKLNQWLDPFDMAKETQPSLVLPSLRQVLAGYYQEQAIEPNTSLPMRQLECSSCHFCSACTAVCPHQALTINENGETKSLLYNPALCTQCGLCLDICLAKKLSWGEKLTIEQLLSTQTLRQSPAYTCSSCGHTYHSDPPSEDNLCHFCR